MRKNKPLLVILLRRYTALPIYFFKKGPCPNPIDSILGSDLEMKQKSLMRRNFIFLSEAIKKYQDSL